MNIKIGGAPVGAVVGLVALGFVTPACQGGNDAGQGAGAGAGGDSAGGGASGGGAPGGTGGGGSGGAAGGGTAGGSGGSVALPNPGDAMLATATGCLGVFNPDQVLDYHLQIAPADWQALLADTTYSQSFQAQLRCGDDPAITVAVGRKRSGGSQKVGLKIDVNEYDNKQKFYGLDKLVLENGVSSGSNRDDAEVGAVVGEYLGWRLMVLSGQLSSRAAFARLSVNGGAPVAYVNVEAVDKRFLKARLGNDAGWLYKKSGGDGDGLKTHEMDMLPNPYGGYFCFWVTGGGACAAPPSAQLAVDLPQKLDLPQLLKMGAVQAIIANTDAPLFKDNNFYYYDWSGGGRLYLAWDLDTSMRGAMNVLTGGVGGQTSKYTNVLFTNWRGDYIAVIRELLDTQLTQAAIDGELDRVNRVAAAAIDADPYLDGTTADAVGGLKRWWSQRLPAVRQQISGQ